MPINPAASPPLPLALLICDGAHRDPATGKWTLLGLFNTLQVAQFPFHMPQMIAYLAMTDAQGKVPIKVKIVDSDEIHDPLFIQENEFPIKDPRVVTDIVIGIRGVSFPKPGEYRLQVFANQEFLVERRIDVIAARTE